MRWPALLIAMLSGGGVHAQTAAAPAASAGQAAPSAGVPAVIAAPAGGALVVSGYDLAVHLQPEGGRLSAVARLTLRNDGPVPVKTVALELSSTLEWEGVSERRRDGSPAKLSLTKRRLETDTDHTGAESEAAMELTRPLARGEATELTAIYSGTILRSTARLERSGASAADAELADWDGIAPGGTFLRGFGNVLWYPVIAAPIFLGDGAKLSDAVGEHRQRGRAATARLRLSVEYAGTAPKTGFFCGRMARLQAVADPGRAGESSSSGVATANFDAFALGFGSPTLFVVRAEPQTEGRVIGVVTNDANAAEMLERAAKSASLTVSDWLGGSPEQQPIVVDHPGQPFAQGALLLQSAAEASSSFAAVHLLSHAWFAADEVWLEEGLAQFLPIVAAERELGRPAAMERLLDQRPALALAESLGEDGGQSLVHATREVVYRNKAVAVLWMLRSVAGEEAMKTAFAALRKRPIAERSANNLEAELERTSGKELAWFFRDWVLADKGLPDLSIANAAARPNPGRSGAGEGSLVAVDVHNDGGAEVEVPVTVRSGALTATERLRVPAHGSASTRILFQERPDEVEVNDGSVPEVSASRHVRALQQP